MAKVDFSQILQQQVGSAPEPRPIPEGTYFGEIAGLPVNRVASTKEGDKPVVAINIALTEPDSDVDAEALAEAGGLLTNSGEPKRVRKEFWLDDSSRYQLDRFLAGFGLEGSYESAFAELPGRAVTVYVTLDEYKTKTGDTRTVNSVSRVFARE